MVMEKTHLSSAPETARGSRRLITLLVPARNEEGNLSRVYDTLTNLFATLPYDYEAIVLDNGSIDRTPELSREICRRDPRWRYVRLSRDFGLEGSMSAGLRLAQGDAAIFIFSDLQDPPEYIPQFLAKWEEGYEVVYGVLDARKDEPWWKTIGASLTYGMVTWLADVDIPLNATDFRLLSRRAMQAMNQFSEQHRYMRGLSHWIGFKSCGVPYKRNPRTSGKSKATIPYLFRFAGDALTSYSLAPLRACTFMALALGGCLAAGLCWNLLAALVGWKTTALGLVPGLLLTQIAATFLCAGVLGEYLGRIHLEVKHRPIFLVAETANVSPASAAAINTEATPVLLPTTHKELAGPHARTHEGRRQAV